ncbi:hypothetical protein WME79_36960 [Sorangium sp. So ce726]|uniref:hypothetical protein n=1 Tax=Sorangium sp. So ce726 TaxID=3133319 RepID=UPI003F63C843
MGGDATAPEIVELEICSIPITWAASLVDAVQHGIFEEHGLRVTLDRWQGHPCCALAVTWHFQEIWPRAAAALLRRVAQR